MSVIPVFAILLFVLHASSKNYYLHNTKRRNWYVAFQDCLTRGKQLATINSAEEQKDLEDILAKANIKNTVVWTSGTDSADEGHFVWMSTGQAIGYSKWAKAEPNDTNKKENCLQVNIFDDPKNAEWNDRNCSEPMYYICEDTI